MEFWHYPFSGLALVDYDISAFEKHLSFGKVASSHHQLVWGIDESNIASEQVEGIRIAPTVLPIQCLWRGFLLHVFFQYLNGQVLKHKLQFII